MSDYQMGAVESKFADIIWENEPISSTELARRSEELLSWKKSTTYTVLKKLCEKEAYKGYHIKMWKDEEAARENLQPQIENAQAIIDECGKVK